jgi:hypothetical protein
MACIVAMHLEATELIVLLETCLSSVALPFAALQASSSSMRGLWQQVKSEIVEVRECSSQHGRAVVQTLREQMHDNALRKAQCSRCSTHMASSQRLLR